MHALSKEIEHMYQKNTIVIDFVCLFHHNPVQNITIKQPCMYSAHNDVIYFRRLGEVEINKITKKLKCFL